MVSRVCLVHHPQWGHLPCLQPPRPAPRWSVHSDQWTTPATLGHRHTHHRSSLHCSHPLSHFNAITNHTGSSSSDIVATVIWQQAASPLHMDGSMVQWYSPGGASRNPQLIHVSLGPPESSIKWHLDQFSRICTALGTASLYFTIVRPFPPRNCLFSWGISTLEQSKPITKTASQSVQAFLQGSLLYQNDKPTDRPKDGQTDKPHYSVWTTGRICIHRTAMHPNNNTILRTLCKTTCVSWHPFCS